MPSNKATKYVRQKVTEWQGEMDESTNIFNPHLNIRNGQIQQAENHYGHN